jgi:medium-chain acyl-[acyl-carrier-protein] hydrolase
MSSNQPFMLAGVDARAKATQKAGHGSWVRFHGRTRNARIRLFCLPYAGGGASAYRAWIEALPPEIEGCSIQLPGREDRLDERVYTRMEPLVANLATALLPYLDMPFALFGHSMGAAIAYEIACKLQFMGRNPLHLLTSACRAPNIRRKQSLTYTMSDDAFIDELRRLGGTPAEVLTDPDLMSLMLPLLRGDFELSETYYRPTLSRLDIPLSVFGGVSDQEIDESELRAWQDVTTGPFSLKMFSGNHFYFQDSSNALASTIAELLAQAVSRRDMYAKP